jgi:hypothetical protein
MVDFAIETKDGKKIKKVLSIIADPKITAVDAQNGEAVLNGRVNYKVLFVNEDEEVVSLDYFADYKDKIAAPEITPTSRLAAKTDVIDVEIGGDGNVVVSLVIENSLYMIAQEAIPALKDVADNYLGERRKIFTQSYLDALISSTEISDEVATGTNVSQVLMFDAAVAVDESVVGNGIITINATVFANVLYVNADGAFENKQFAIPVTEEQQTVQGTDVRAFTDAVIKNTKVVLSGSEGNNIIRIEAIVQFDTTIIVTVEEEIVSDLFSVSNEITVKTEKFSASKFLESAAFRDTVNGSVNLDESRPAVGEILACVGVVNKLAAVKPSGEKVIVEGVVGLTVIYKDIDEVIDSVDIEIPYSIATKRPTMADESYRLEGKGAAGTVTVKRRRDRELDVSAELFFSIQAYGEDGVYVISDVVETETKKDVSAISVYNTAPGETLWDIAKALSAPPEEILKQNGELVIPVKSPGRVLLYRCLE